MIPIRDVNPSLRRPWLTWGVIAAALYVFFVLQPAELAAAERFAYRTAAIPCEITTGQPLSQAEIQGGSCSADDPPVFPGKSPYLAVLSSLFLHANLFHLLGNMWILWIFGNNVEDAYGRLSYGLLYLIAGVAATVAFVLLRPQTTVPLVGASGAIAGVMGAYFVLFPRAAVVTIIPIFLLPWVVAVPAWVFLGLWFVGQFFIAEATNVAWEAHVAGFAVGMAASVLMGPWLRRRIRRHRRLLLTG